MGILCVGVCWDLSVCTSGLLGFKYYLCIINWAVMKAGLCKTLEKERIAERERDSAHGGIAILKITCVERAICKRRRRRIKPHVFICFSLKKNKNKKFSKRNAV